MQKSEPDKLTISSELQSWLDARTQAIRAKANIARDGGHMMLKEISYDPEALDEPLRSEALAYFKSLDR